MRKRKGAISVFLIVVLFACVFLGALFIDASRVLLAQRAVRNAANSAARSALASYDTNLAKEYGMFAVEEGTAKEAFTRYFTNNIELSQNDGFNILPLEVKEENITVNLTRPITDDDVMQEAMNEYAKYRVLVNTSVGVIEKVKGLFDKSKDVFDSADLGKNAKEQMEFKRTQVFDGLNKLLHTGVTTQQNKYKNAMAKLLRTSTNQDEVNAKSKEGKAAIDAEIDAAQKENDKLLAAADEYDETNREAAAQLDQTKNATGQYWDEESETWKEAVPEEVKDVHSEEEVDAMDTMSTQVREEKAEMDEEITATRNRVNSNQAEIDRLSEDCVKINQRVAAIDARLKEIEKVDLPAAQGRVTAYTEAEKAAQAVIDGASATKSFAEKKIKRLEQGDKDDPYDFVLDAKEGLKYLSDDKDLFDTFENTFYGGDKEKFEDFKEKFDNIKLALEIERLLGGEADDSELYAHLKKGGITEPKTAVQLQIAKLNKTITQCTSEIGTASGTKKKATDEKVKAQAAVDDLVELQGELNTERQEKINKRDNELIPQIEGLYDGMAAGEVKKAELKTPDVSENDKKKAEDAAKDKENSDSLMSLLGELFETVEKAVWLVEEFGKVDYQVDPLKMEELAGEVLNPASILKNVWGSVAQFGEQAGNIVTLISGKGEAAESMLFTDYVFSNCTFLTSQTPHKNRHFQIAEIEYVLKGGGENKSQVECFLSTLAEIYMLRLVINFTDYMITSTIPEIVSRTLAALGRSAWQSVSDVAQLVFTLNGKESASCALCPSLKQIKLTYSDHLRLRMMMDGLDYDKRMKMMERFETMMERTYERKKWGELEKRKTAISADVAVEVELVMLTLPMFEALLPEDNPILQDGKFIVREHVSLTY